MLKKVHQDISLLDPDKYSKVLVKVSLWEYAFYNFVLDKAKLIASFSVNYVFDSDFVSVGVTQSN